jgi:hypothetical protein
MIERIAELSWQFTEQILYRLGQALASRYASLCKSLDFKRPGSQVDVVNYCEISTVEVDGRCVLDMASYPLDDSLAMVTIEPDSMSSSVRVYHVGRRRSQVRCSYTAPPSEIPTQKD